MDQDLNELIEKYLDGTLPEEALHALEVRLKTDAMVTQQLEVVKQARQVLIYQKMHLLKNVIQNEKDVFLRRGKQLNRLIGLGLLLFTVAVLLFIPLNKKSKINMQPATKFSKPTNTAATKTPAASGNIKVNATRKPVATNVNPSATFRPETAEVEINEHQENKTPAEAVPLVPPAKDIVETRPLKIPLLENTREAAIVLPEDLCKNGISNVSFQTVATCLGKEEGEVHVTHVKGGSAPYSYTLGQNEARQEGAFSGLSSGNYQLTITDKNGCQKTYKNIYIADKDCRKNYEFNPSNGQYWEIPEELGRGIFTIYDHAGKVYFKKNIQQGTHETWSGESPSGEIVQGYFMYVIQHENGKTEQGSITISR